MKAQVLLVALLPAVLTGCGGCSDDPTAAELMKLTEQVSAVQIKLTAFEHSLAERDDQARASLGEATEASLAAVTERLGGHDIAGAYDFLLAAMRLNPSDPAVFNAAMDFVGVASQSDEDELLELGSDIYVRCDRLIPFLPVPQIATARQRWLETELAPPPSPPATVSLPGDSLLAEVKAVATADVPAHAASLALQHIRSELQSLAASAALDAQEESFWDRWNTADAALERAETEVLVRLHRDRRQKYQKWLDQRASALDDYSKSKTDDLHSLSQRFGDIIQEGYRLRSEMAPFAEAGIADAVNDQKELDKHLDLLESAKEWMHNQHALALLDYLQNRSDAEPLEKLKRMARYHEQRLSPYVLQRFQEQWERFFEELDSEEQRVEATKARVLQGAKL